LLGVPTAIGGGLLRDVLAGQPTLLKRRELYAIPVTCGCILYVMLLTWLPTHAVLIGVACSSLILLLRGSAIYWDLHVPLWLATQSRHTDTHTPQD
ncbi:MAG TPA: hypothetical protein DCM07_20680, partial [Planctomycetaceae bacterium]|nr:hypothetical protein [Planctomycetaceae bacterium]